MASKSKKAAQLVRYFVTVYYYKVGEKGMVGRFFHKNIFGKRPTLDWLKQAIQTETGTQEVTVVTSIMVSKEEFEYQQHNTI